MYFIYVRIMFPPRLIVECINHTAQKKPTKVNREGMKKNGRK
ncbi:hypothetical protein KR50_34650 [Jeotgalibacillus campisalis]|uniref:Uncharacterized protein n=1 Tax=Jeotgalibacillus campisalis TaxID=220754 RepID=A0A0C2V1Z2_9BACL|nr:hypothetical protein KR50_34650 [Jeotgalibacillus campisalis]